MVRAAAVEVSHRPGAPAPLAVGSVSRSRKSVFAMISAIVCAIIARWGTRAQGAQLFPEHQFVVAPRSAVSLIAGAFFFVLCSGTDSWAEGSPGACDDVAELAFLASPMAPWKGAPFRVVFAAEKPLGGEIRLTAPDGSIAA